MEAGGLVVARITDLAECVNGPKDMISQGSATVTVGGLPVARKGDKTMHGGVIIEGDENIEIGGPTIGVGGEIHDASLEEARAIILAHVRAQQMIDAALTALRNALNQTDSRLSDYFKIEGTADDDRGDILMLIFAYQRMRDKIKGIGYTVKHEEIEEGKPFVVASVDKYWLFGWNRYGDVNVCFPAFSSQSAEDRAKTVVHEMAHRAWGVDDIVYEWETEDWNAMDRDDRMNNADSYGEFAGEVVED